EDNPLECPRWRKGSGRRAGDHAPITVDRKGVQVLHSGRRIWTRRRDPPPAHLPALPPGGQPGADLDHGRHPAEARRRTERARRSCRGGAFPARRGCLSKLTQLSLILTTPRWLHLRYVAYV